jgi:rod shape-determining protein MreD
MSAFLSIPILAIAAALQASFVPQVRLLGGGPDLVLLLVLSWSINSSLREAVTWAFVGGIMLDLLSYNPTGTSSAGLLIIVFAISGLGQRVHHIGFMMIIGLVLFGTLLQQITIMLILALTGYPIDLITGLTYVAAPTILYDLILIWPIYWFVRRTQKRTYRRDTQYSNG